MHTSDGQRSRLRRMKNGVPFSHWCCLTSISAIFRKQHLGSTVTLTIWPFYCDAHLGRKRKRVSTKTTILVDYLRKWRPQLSIGKTVSAAYHLNNREAKRKLDVFVDNKRLVFQQAPKYLGVCLDRMLNFKQHLDEVAGKVTSRESHSSVVLLVQPGEPLPKHYGSPRKPWYSPQLNTVLLPGAEAHTRRRLMSQSTALYGPYLVVSSRHLFFISLS